VSRYRSILAAKANRALPNLEKQHGLFERAPVELAHRLMQSDKHARRFPQLCAANPN
jgi:hypothetical protein